jgi:hypothetical protein
MLLVVVFEPSILIAFWLKLITVNPIVTLVLNFLITQKSQRENLNTLPPRFCPICYSKIEDVGLEVY